ncbi:glycosyltransferase family 4 protein [Mycobacterium sp. DL592]|uniref:glycosyltransferase family 4 protein n=1 Tax=Mycobacterium sp. DL592 TaxID=2675524 RepID=UPI00141FDCBB|nr:glycosyltransferase family 4 protein [Mycobacterium sp. DL592]
MKVLLLTPYSPLTQHDHAANDLMRPLVNALAGFSEVHVYAPGQRNGTLDQWKVDGVTYHAGSAVRRTQLDRISPYPYAGRGSWSRQSTREALAVARTLRPDILHAEYNQTAEALLRCDKHVRHTLMRTSITLHDLSWGTAERSLLSHNMIRKWMQEIERVKMRRTRSAILTNVDAALVYSKRDKEKLSDAAGIVEVVPVGVEPPRTRWIGDRPHTAVFGGAMWRAENEVAAVFLAREVMPLVRQVLPTAELRVFGARPTALVRALDGANGVTVVGQVDDYDDEFLHAAVSLAPSMVDAGVFLKAIRPMAMGCPVILNSASASPIAGLVPGLHALVGDGAQSIANHIVTTMQNTEQARQLGGAAMDLAREHYSWERTANAYMEVFRRMLQGQSPFRGADSRPAT